jgi:hypothetical protein
VISRSRGASRHPPLADARGLESGRVGRRRASERASGGQDYTMHIAPPQCHGRSSQHGVSKVAYGVAPGVGLGPGMGLGSDAGVPSLHSCTSSFTSTASVIVAITTAQLPLIKLNFTLLL